MRTQFHHTHSIFSRLTHSIVLLLLSAVSSDRPGESDVPLCHRANLPPNSVLSRRWGGPSGGPSPGCQQPCRRAARRWEDARRWQHRPPRTSRAKRHGARGDGVGADEGRPGERTVQSSRQRLQCPRSRHEHRAAQRVAVGRRYVRPGDLGGSVCVYVCCVCSSYQKKDPSWLRSFCFVSHRRSGYALTVDSD